MQEINYSNNSISPNLSSHSPPVSGNSPYYNNNNNNNNNRFQYPNSENQKFSPTGPSGSFNPRNFRKSFSQTSNTGTISNVGYLKINGFKNLFKEETSLRELVKKNYINILKLKKKKKSEHCRKKRQDITI